jgi:hypothetical protein
MGKNTTKITIEKSSTIQATSKLFVLYIDKKAGKLKYKRKCEQLITINSPTRKAAQQRNVTANLADKIKTHC